LNEKKPRTLVGSRRRYTRLLSRAALTDSALFLFALSLRLFAALSFQGEPVWDGHYYDYYAKRIAEGHGYSDAFVQAGIDIGHASCHYPVGYSGFLGAFYFVFGSAPPAAAWFNAIVGALLVVSVRQLAAFSLSSRRALCAGILAAVHPGLVVYAALTMSEPLAALLTLAAFVVTLSAKRIWLAQALTPTASPRTIRVRLLARLISTALLLGCSTLVRPPALLCVPLVAAVYAPMFAPSLSEYGEWRRILASWMLPVAHYVAACVCILSVALLVVLPWTVRNCVKMDGCALVSTNGGWNLAIGAFPRATGRFESLHSADGCREVSGQVQQDRCWLAYGVSHIRREPLRWLGLVPKKWAFTLDHESFPVEYLHEAAPARFPDERRAAARLGLGFFHQVLVVIAAFSSVASVIWSRTSRSLMARGAVWLHIAGFSLALLVALWSLAGSPPSVWPICVFGMLTYAVLQAFAPTYVAGPERWVPGAVGLSWGLVGSVLVTHAIFFGEDRYHMVLSPVLCILAASIFPSPQRPTLVSS
jgi:hypothetical protein